MQCAFSSVIRHVDSSYLEQTDVMPAPDDVLVRVGDHVLPSGQGKLAQVLLLRALLDLRNRQFEPGDRAMRRDASNNTWVLATFQHKDDPTLRNVWCRLGTLPLDSLAPSVLWFLLKLGLFGIGALVFWKRPTDRSAAQFFLLCIVTLAAYMGGYHWVRIATQPFLLVVFMVAAVLLPAVSLHFYLVFPRPKQFLEQRGGVTLAFVYGLPLLFLGLLVLSYLQLRSVARSTLPEDYITNAWLLLRNTAAIYLGLATLWYVASVVGLVHSFFAAATNTERNQVKWIMAAAVLSLLPIGYTLYLIAGKPDDFGVGAATWPMFAASFFLTVAFAVSITRYRLMQLDQIVSSGAVYFFISSLAGLVYYALVLAGMLATDIVGSHVVSGSLLTQTVWVSASFLVFMLALDLVRSRFKRALDRRFYRDKFQLDRTLRRLGQAIEQLVDPATVARRFLQASAELLSVARGAVYLREGEPAIYRLSGHLGQAPTLVELPPGAPLVAYLENHGSLVASAVFQESAYAAQRQLRYLGGEAAHALRHEGKPLAILLLGPKDLGMFVPEDLNFLSAFAQLAAVALESAEGHRTIETLNRDLRDKVDKISEQQRRILALQSQLTRQASRDKALAGDGETLTNGKDGAAAEAPAFSANGILGSSAPMRILLDMVRKVSATQSAVLIRGESGTGKELLARALHENSSRAAKPYVKVHCAALSTGLLESELFGHVKGAFTGAHKDKVGRFELANGGTVFLDEVGDIGLETQTKLLRVLQEKTFERVGSSESIQVDVRILAATHQNLEAFIRQGRFREDLYYRLKVIDIEVPTLRERREDIPELAQHFLQLYAQRSARGVLQIDDDALAALKGYDWPGNIRQLENVMERAVVICDGPSIMPHDLPADVRAEGAHVAGTRQNDRGTSHRGQSSRGLDAEETVPVASFGYGAESEPAHGAPLSKALAADYAERDRRERESMVRALAAARGNKAEAARLLGLARSTFLSRLKKHGLS